MNGTRTHLQGSAARFTFTSDPQESQDRGFIHQGTIGGLPTGEAPPNILHAGF